MLDDLPGLPDLHRHLDGSLRRATALELAERYDVDVPQPLAFTAGMGLAAALELFAFSTAILQHPSAVRRVADEICEDAAAEGVTTLEIRFAPQLHRRASLHDIIDAALEGIDGRAGLILCGLYGEPPKVLERLVSAAAERPGVVGIDLAGGPVPGHSFGMGDYAPAFTRARDLNIGRTVHAGEGRPPAEIRVAVEMLYAQRIGHGTTVLDDPEVVELLIERNVVIEACPTSNVHTGVIASVAQHPLPAWLDRGLKACVCTDNTLFSNAQAREELQRVASIPGVGPEHLAAVIETGHGAAFRRSA
jgi:adenosine deaminase